ncbi:acyl-CoA dehydrogenase family protein [Brevibacillus dissolubilis]|uniref:acyl-CoA dehydrogenase family protein n=1 Tax=Brevibacillus dissolubilis TaxID=1844116 RepID=UPI001115CFC1|nr:acyl-CoA dehydrogenase family protein [Brevibacillus dissolubilis]
MEHTRLHIRGGQFLVATTDEQDVFTPEDCNEEHRMIAQTTDKFIEHHVAPHYEAIEQQDFGKVVELLHTAGELGLLGHSVPEQYGGLGMDKITKSIVGEQIGRAGAYSVAHANHTCIATLPITYFGTPEQKAKYLPKLASGEYIGAYCLTEPSSGSDALGAKTTAKLNDAGTHYVFHGTKQYITNAEFADTFIVYAKVDGDKFTAFLLEKDYPGLSLGPEENKMGIKGSSTRPVILEDCLVPVENVLGEVGRGHLIAFNVLNLGRFNLGSACMGGAKYSLKLAIDYTLTRQQFGKPLAAFPATQEKLANMASRIYASESMQYRTAQLLEQALGDLYEETDHKLITQRLAEFAIECAMCKVFGSETLDGVNDEALQLHGGYGYIKEYAIERMYRDGRINRIFEGTNEINRLIVPSFLARKVKTGDLPVMEAVKQAVKELYINDGKLFADSAAPLTREKAIVASIRRVFLALLGVANETLGDRLDTEQETVMKLSDIAIHLYAAESAVLRTAKAITCNGREQEQMKELLTLTYVDEALLEVEMLARKLLSGLFQGETLHTYLSLVQKELHRYPAEATVTRNRTIARRLLDAQKYTCQ